MTTREIQPGKTLTQSDYTVVEVSGATYRKAPYSFILEQESGGYVGHPVPMHYRKDTYLSTVGFEKAAASESPIVPAEGMRAMTLNVDEVTGLAGLLRAEDHVDIIIVQRLMNIPGTGAPDTGGGGGAPRVSYTGQPMLLNVFRNVRILAAGRRTDVASVESGGQAGYSTITVELPVDKATILAAERLFSQITLLLRNPGDMSSEGDIFNLVVDSAKLQEALDEYKKKGVLLPVPGGAEPTEGGVTPPAGGATTPPVESGTN
jgi:Flp pilus assembly protein CpaB